MAQRIGISSMALFAGVAFSWQWNKHTLAVLNADPKQDTPNPLDCKDIVCDDKKKLFMSRMRKTTDTKSPDKKLEPQECPLDRAQLGRSTWEFLHTTAAYYPDEPNEDEKQAARQLINSVAVLYPCLACRTHFAKEVKEDPPDVSNRQNFAKWLCKRHNNVNKWLDKPIFDCSFANLDERWRKGTKECQALHEGDEISDDDPL